MAADKATRTEKCGERRSTHVAGADSPGGCLGRLHRGVGQAMSGDVLGYLVSGLIALVITGYLVIAMLFPEKF